MSPPDAPSEVYLQWIVVLEERIRNAVVSGRSAEEAYALVVQETKSEWAWNPSVLEQRLTAVSEAYARYHSKLDRVSYLQRVAIRFGKERWYAGPADNSENWN